MYIAHTFQIWKMPAALYEEYNIAGGFLPIRYGKYFE